MNTEALSRHPQISSMESFARIFNWFYLLTFVEKLSIFDVCGVPGYSSEYLRYCKWKKKVCCEIQIFVNLVSTALPAFWYFFQMHVQDLPVQLLPAYNK